MIYVALINGMGYGEDSEGGALQNIVGARDADFMYMGNDFIKGPGISDFASDGLKVQALSTPDNTVNIAPGGVYIANATGMRDSKTTRLWKLYSTAIENIEIPANASGNPRIDLVVAKVTKVGNPGEEGELAGSFEVVQGTPGAVPAAPAVPDDCYALTQIAVANNFTTITNANITDVRTQALISSEKVEHLLVSKSKVGFLTITANGNYAISDLGFKPHSALFVTTIRTASSTSATLNEGMGIGMADRNGNMILNCATSRLTYGSGVAIYSNKCIGGITIAMSGTVQNPSFLGTVSAWGDDSLTVNITDWDANGLVMYQIFGS